MTDQASTGENKEPIIDTIKIDISDFWEFLKNTVDVNERQRRLIAGYLAKKLGFGGITLIHKRTGASENAIRHGIADIEQGNTEGVTEQIRRKGGGRKPAIEKIPQLFETLKKLVEDNTYGNPMDTLVHVNLSLRNISEELEKKGMAVGKNVVGRLLTAMGYSLHANQKMKQVGEQHPLRDKQFEFINQMCNKYMAQGIPVISIDCKKKENLGNFKNNGKEYRLKGDPRPVLDHDFMDKKLGKVAPYGVYVLNDNTGFINLGTSSDTAEFAAESCRRWWDHVGKPNFADKKEIYIVCDGGGSNGARVRLWKLQLAKLAEQTGLAIHVSHMPPGTSKWNKIEHRMFCYISKSWAAKPLYEIQTVVSLIRETKTKGGLKIDCMVDKNAYKTGIKVSNEEMDSIDIEYENDLEKWNYVIRGFKKKAA